MKNLLIGATLLAIPALLALAIASSVTAATQDFRSGVVRPEVVEPRQAPAAYFTGNVTLKPLTNAKAPGQPGTALVSFDKGARSHWHSHPAGQTLYVTQSCGWAQEEGGPVQRICAGDVVYVAPGVRHWHGASSVSAMTHLAISEMLEGKNVDWAEAVTDAQYHGPDDGSAR